MSNKSNLLQSYEEFARSVYQKTGINDEIEIIVPKAHYMMLLQELSDSPFSRDEPRNYPYFLKIFTSVLSIRITYNYCHDLK